MKRIELWRPKTMLTVRISLATGMMTKVIVVRKMAQYADQVTKLDLLTSFLQM